MRVAVTGAAGFIGTALVARLRADGHDVVALVRRPASAGALHAAGAEVRGGDVRDAAAVGAALAGTDVVCHLARAKGHGIAPAAVVQSVNVDGAGVVAAAAVRAGAHRLVLASSTAVYGSRRPGETLTEDAPVRPDSAYARSKVEAEARALGEARARGAVVIARITNVLGPAALSSLSLIRSVASGSLPVIGRGANRHHPADVDDIVDGLVRCVSSPAASGTYNLAGPEAITLRELLACIARATGARPPRTIPRAPVDAWLALDRGLHRLTSLHLPRTAGPRFLTSDRRLDLSRARRDLGYAPSIGVDEAVRRTVAWYRAAGVLPPA